MDSSRSAVELDEGGDLGKDGEFDKGREFAIRAS
jgi:hypothetical protein